MKKEIITIDQHKCSGCGACATACHMGAIGIVDGKARLMREDYCDGLGRCLPVCPTGAISFEEHEAKSTSATFHTEDSQSNMENAQPETLACGCPGTNSKILRHDDKAPEPMQGQMQLEANTQSATVQTQLQQWPVQIKLVPINAPYFHNANLLIAADCTAYAYGNFHAEYMRNRITIIGCPKLDEGDYAEKLTAIIERNEIKSVTIARMEVPCCTGIENATKTALKNSGKMIPWQIVIISTDGKIITN